MDLSHFANIFTVMQVILDSQMEDTKFCEYKRESYYISVQDIADLILY